MCVRQSMLEELHRGLWPITKIGDYSDVVVVDAEGRRLPWPEISRFDEDEMRDLMRQIVNKIYTFLAKMDDPDFTAWRGIMSKSVTSPYDVAEHLRTPEEMAAYLEASMEEADGDAAFIAKALGDLARAKGMSQVAYEADLSRESLYKALSGDRNPSLDTFLRVVGALGLRLRAEAVQGPEEAGPGVSAHR